VRSARDHTGLVKTQVAALGLVAWLVIGTGLASPATAQTAPKDVLDCAVVAQGQAAGPKLSFLFVFDGRNAEFKPVKSNADQFELLIPIKKSNHLVTWFTDRPNRDAGQMDLTTFASVWQQAGQDTFKVDPPNVALAFDNKTLIATMTQPKVVTTKEGNKAFKSTMTLLKGQALNKVVKENKNLRAHAKRAADNSHAGSSQMPVISVFVDGGPCQCITGMCCNDQGVCCSGLSWCASACCQYVCDQ